MNIELRRYRFKPETIDGQIWIDGGKVCDSAENARHSLPPGEYSIILARRHPKDRKMPTIIADGKPMLSHGNGVYSLQDGSILLGRYLAPGIVTHSRPAFNSLYQRIRKNLERSNKVYLIIQNP